MASPTRAGSPPPRRSPADPYGAPYGQPAGGDWELSPPGPAEQRTGAPPAPPQAPGGHPGPPPAPPGPPAPPAPGVPAQHGPGPGSPQQGGPAEYAGPPAPDHGMPAYGMPEHGAPDHGGPEHAAQGGGVPQGGGAWTATIAPDRTYFMAMMQRSGPEAAALNLPAYSPEQQLQLTGPQVTIGAAAAPPRGRPRTSIWAVPRRIPGSRTTSTRCCVQQPDGSWSVVDQDSTNGTTINGAEEPVQPFVPVPLKEGDRVHVGAWTTITLVRR